MHKAKQAYEAFIEPIKHNPRVTQLLFNDTAYIRENVSDYWLPYYLLKTGLMQQNTNLIRNAICCVGSLLMPTVV